MFVPRPLLWVEDLEVGYGLGARRLPLFKELNFSLRQGQLVCLMGPNAIGKSTLLRTLAGLQKPLHGRVCMPGQTVQQPEPEKIAIVLTDRITSSNLTCRDLVGFGRYPFMGWAASYRPEDSEIIDECLAKVGLSDLANKPLQELSDGQLQMVMIARALAQRTPVLLLDEPSAHLDLNNRLEIMKLLRSLAKDEGKAILISTHELDLALQLADRVLLAGKDKALKQGIPEDLVLNGSFDDIFRLKGFDLRTGRLTPELSGSITVRLQGEGHAWLWTKNALERNGITVSDYSHLNIIVEGAERSSWTLEHNAHREVFTDLEGLITRLDSPR